MTTPLVSSFSITGYFSPEAPPTLTGSIVRVLFKYEGLDWTQLGDTPPNIPIGKAFHLAVQWLNQSIEAICGHVNLTITRPNGSKVTLQDVLNQDNWAIQGNGWGVEFEPVTLDVVGNYTAEINLSSMGQNLSVKSIIVAAVSQKPWNMSLTGHRFYLYTVGEINIYGPDLTIHVENPNSVHVDDLIYVGFRDAGSERIVTDLYNGAPVGTVVPPGKWSPYDIGLDPGGGLTYEFTGTYISAQFGTTQHAVKFYNPNVAFWVQDKKGRRSTEITI